MKKTSKKLKPWQVVLLVIFYPIGLIYLAYRIVCFIYQVYHEKQENQRRIVEEQEKCEALRVAKENAQRKYEEIHTARINYLQQERNKFSDMLRSIPRIEIIPDPNAEKKNINVSDFYLECSTLRKNTNLSRVVNFVVIDTETTGLVPGQHKIVQVSAIRFENATPSAIFTTYINPGCHIAEAATRINGITDEMVADSPSFESILPDLERFIGASTIVGHNISFDLKFLRKFGYDSLKENRLYFDTLELSRKYDDIDNHKLSDACKEHNIYFNSHDSSEDALATGLLFIDYLKEKQMLSGTNLIS